MPTGSSSLRQLHQRSRRRAQPDVKSTCIQRASAPGWSQGWTEEHPVGTEEVARYRTSSLT